MDRKYRNDVTTGWQYLISALSSPSPRSMKTKLKAYLGTRRAATQVVIHEVTPGLDPFTNINKQHTECIH